LYPDDKMDISKDYWIKDIVVITDDDLSGNIRITDSKDTDIGDDDFNGNDSAWVFARNIEKVV